MWKLQQGLEGFEQRSVMICFQSFNLAPLLRMNYVGVKVEGEKALRSNCSHPGFDQNDSSGDEEKRLNSRHILNA